MFVSRASGKHPVMVGPSIIHMTKEFKDYHYLASQLKKTCKGFDSLPAYGTDGEINPVKAFICELPESVHLRCKIHLADDIESKLSKLAFWKEREISYTVVHFWEQKWGYAGKMRHAPTDLTRCWKK